MKIGLILLLFLSFSQVFAKIVVITDLDETIKHTTCEVPSTWSAIGRAVFGNKVYSAMPELHRQFERYADRQYVLTGSPVVVKPMIWRLIRKNQIPIDGVYTNSLIPPRKTFSYKMRKIKKIFRSFPNHKFILIGDNTGKDELVYREISKNNPDRVLAIYIHKVKPTDAANLLNEEVTYYYSAYEVAYYEYVKGRMQLNAVQAVYDKLFDNEEKLKNLFPHKVYCPTKKNYFDHMDDEGLKEFTMNMRKKIINYCQKRS